MVNRSAMTAVLYLVVISHSVSSAYTIFEKFDSDVISSGTWVYTKTENNGANAGSINYNQETQAVVFNVARDTANTTRLCKELGFNIQGISEFWLEYDFSVGNNNSGAVYSIFGLFNSNATNDDPLYNVLGLRPRSVQGRFFPAYNSGTLNANFTDTAIDSWQTGVNYRDKTHVYTIENTTYINSDIYTLDGNDETPLSTGSKIALFPSDTLFVPGLNSIGFSNAPGTRAGSNNLAVDNFYFSTEGPNENTAAPFVLPAQEQRSGLTYFYVAPNQSGIGSGEDRNNPAKYSDTKLWNKVAEALNTANVNVVFINSDLYGTHSVNYPSLNLVNFGNSLKKLTLIGDSKQSVIWNHSSTQDEIDYYIKLEGSQNIRIQNMTFQGNCLKWGVSLVPNNKKPARNISIDNCAFKNLRSSYYGALGVSDVTSDVLITDCEFDNVGSGPTAHMIYGTRAINIKIDNCSFTDCVSEYLKIRNDSDYWTVTNCIFKSTSQLFDYSFFDICALNSTSATYAADDPMEYFGTNFEISGNSFSAFSAASNVDAVDFRGLGFDAYGYEGNGIRLTSQKGDILQNGSAQQKRYIMEDSLGIIGEKVIVRDNSYHNIRHRLSYTYRLAWNSTSAGWVGSADIFNASNQTQTDKLGLLPQIINGNFEKIGYPIRNWRYNNRNQVIPTVHTGLNNTPKAIKLDKSLLSHQIFQWLFNTSPLWQADFCVAMGHFTQEGEKLRIEIIHNETADGKLAIAIDNNGRIGLYDGTTLNILPELGQISFCVDSNNDGDYSDTGDQLNWYHFQITGDYRKNPSFSIQVSDANTYQLNPQKRLTDLKYWVNNHPGPTLSPAMILFTTSHCDAVIDEVQFTGQKPNSWIQDGTGLEELVKTTDNWLNRNSRNLYDFCEDGQIDLKDFAFISKYWLGNN